MYQITRHNHKTPSADPFAVLARDFFGVPLPQNRSAVPAHAPRFDFADTPENYTLHADVPGVAEEDLEITVHEGILSVSGKRSEEPLEDGSSFLVRERQSGSFERRFKLPKDANAEQVQAKLNAGVLIVSIAKKEERKARKIALG